MSHALQLAILDRSRRWADRGCKETFKNGGACIDKVHELFGRLTREAYCAKFVYIVVAQACVDIKADNRLPKTAGARDLLERCRRAGFRIDDTPTPGCAFYHLPQIRDASGHVGLVYSVGPERVMTVEGNNEDRIGYFTYSWEKIRSKKMGYQFIHIEEMDGALGPDAGTVARAGIGPLLGVALIAAGYYAYRWHEQRSHQITAPGTAGAGRHLPDAGSPGIPALAARRTRRQR